MFHWVYETLSINSFHILLTKILILKKHVISNPYAWVYFSRSRCNLLKGRWAGRGGGVVLISVWGEYIKNFHLKDVNKWKPGNGRQYFLRIGTPLLQQGYTEYIFEQLSVYIYFFRFSRLLLYILRENRTKLKKILNLNHWSKCNTNSKI